MTKNYYNFSEELSCPHLSVSAHPTAGLILTIIPACN